MKGQKWSLLETLHKWIYQLGQISGLGHSINILKKIKGIEILKLDVSDIVRHPIVSKLLMHMKKLTLYQTQKK